MNPDQIPDSPPMGVVVIDKPKDWTSFDVVAKIRRIFSIKKVGHAGTLDPMATGVLIILVGKATKWSDHLLTQDKQYLAEITFGSQTDTGDAEGRVIDQKDSSHVTESQVKHALAKLTGDRAQMVPAYAAVKVGGKKLYQLARSGQTIQERPVRNITIHALELLTFIPGDKDTPPKATINVHCSKGTYIRVLAEEIAELCDTVAHLTSLRRTASGQFTLDQAVTLDELIDSPNPEQYLLQPDIPAKSEDKNEIME